MLIAKVENTTTGEVERVYRTNGASAPAFIYGVEQCLGYWESRFEIFTWACDALGWSVWDALFEDGFTGEVLDWYELMDEELDGMED